MSNFAQVITSFERAGNFPLEANYIFPTVEALKEFYSDPLQAALLHKGLLKVVERNAEGNQALYWVTKKQTNDELEFTELIAGKNVEDINSQIGELLKKLEEEITARKNADTALWGTNDPSGIDEDLNSINDLATSLKGLKTAISKLEEATLTGENSLKKQLKAVVGTTENDIISYLDTLPYHSITEIAKELDRIVNGEKDPETGEVIQTDAIDTLPELADFLEGFTNKDTLKKILEDLWLKIEGDVLPSAEFRTLRGVEDFLIKYVTANATRQKTLQEELDNIESGVGLNADGTFSADNETYYLKGATSIMNALKTLDSMLHRYISANTPQVRNTDEALQLSITQELDSYVLAAALKLSTQGGNQLIKNSDGLYCSAKTYYEDGVLTFRVNGNIVSQHYIGLSSVVHDARYDKDNELLIFEFKLQNGDIQTVKVPVGALIREWEPYNRDTSAVVLERYEDISGTDKLMADVRISTKQWNILEKIDGALFVKGTTDNIYHGGTLLSEYISSIEQNNSKKIEELLEKIAEAKTAADQAQKNLDKEIQDRQNSELTINSKLDGLNQSVANAVQKVTDEEAERKKADTTLQTNIDSEVKRASLEEAKLQQNITGEFQRAQQAEQNILNQVNGVDDKLEREIKRSTEKDIEFAQKLENIVHDNYAIEKQSTPEPGCIATYYLTKNGVQSGVKIDVPDTKTIVSVAYDKGILTILVDGTVAGTVNLSQSSAVDSSQFDTAANELIQVFNLVGGGTQTVKTSFQGLMEAIRKEFAPIESPVLTGVPKVAVSPDDNDSSQRIPSTAWVKARIEEALGAVWIEVE